MVHWDLPHDPLEELRAGNPAPFEGFVRSHARLLIEFFRRLGAEAHRAEDLAQEVFVKLFDHAPKYRNENRFRALVYRVARNVWIDERRREDTRRELAPRGPSAGRPADPEDGSSSDPLVQRPDPSLPDPTDRASVVEESARLRAALAELPDRHRLVFELSVIEELEYAEIARLLEIPVGTVKSRMYHAVRKLRRAAGESTE